MARQKRSVVATDPHKIRLVQRAPVGTPGSYIDATMRASWTTTRKGLNGVGGFVSIENAPILNDAGEFTIILPPVGNDGVRASDRFYHLSTTPDITGSGATVPYYPGDEWIEVYRGVNELVAVGTPISSTTGIDQISIVCRDVLHSHKKTRETSGGFWANAPRDVFEHYTRLWVPIIADDFADSPVQFTPLGGIATSQSTPNGVWYYQGADGSAGSSFVTLIGPVAGLTNCAIYSQHPFADGGQFDHSCWRAEARLVNPNITASDGGLILTIADQTLVRNVATLGLYPSGVVQVTTTDTSGVTTSWPTNTTGLTAVTGAQTLAAPYTFAIEARDRWYLFWLQAQLVGISPRPDTVTGNGLSIQISANLNQGSSVGIDYAVLRATTPPLIGGTTGDYTLASSPAPGGLTGQYFDTGATRSQIGCQQLLLAGGPSEQVSVIERVDTNFATFVGNPPTWQGNAFSGSFAVRWTGAIYLPLATTNITFGLPNWPQGSAPGYALDVMRIWVGRTRGGEQVLSNWYADGTCSFTCNYTNGSAVLTNVSSFLNIYVGQYFPGMPGDFPGGTVQSFDPVAATITMTGPAATGTQTGILTGWGYSIGMRQFLGQVSGWYPIVVEYGWTGQTGDARFTYNIGSGYVVPAPSVISPLGVYRNHIKSDSHYDTLRSLSDQYQLQFRTRPQQLESGFFPGSIVPRTRVGRDTDYFVDLEEAINPQVTIQAEDVASALLADASGLGGISSGTLTAEAFNFANLGQHPFVSQEYENLPATTVGPQFIMHLLSLLGYRSGPWEDVQVQTVGQRSMQDTFPLTGLLSEFDWQPGDGLRILLPQIGVVDTVPRQILSLKRMLWPDGMGENHASLRPRVRDLDKTLRKFFLQVYGARRTFQGQIVESGLSRAVAPAYAEAVLPSDLSAVRQAELVVLSKSGGDSFSIEVNGTVPAAAPIVNGVGMYDLGPYVSRNNGTEPRMLVRLVSPSGGSQVSYGVRLRTLVTSL